MADPIDLDELEAVIRSGSWTSKEIAKHLGRRHADVSRALRDPRFAKVRDGRRHIWGLALAEAEPERDESEAVPGAAPEEPEEPVEEEPEVVTALAEEDEAPWTIDDLDNALAVVLDREEREVVARLRVISGGHVLADELDGRGQVQRVFEPRGIVDLVSR